MELELEPEPEPGCMEWNKIQQMDGSVGGSCQCGVLGGLMECHSHSHSGSYIFVSLRLLQDGVSAPQLVGMYILAIATI